MCLHWQLGATSSSDSIVGLTEENKLQDIENFGIFKVLKGGFICASKLNLLDDRYHWLINRLHVWLRTESKLNEGNCKEEKSEESCKTQESRTLRESSESSSDLDLKVLDKVIMPFFLMELFIITKNPRIRPFHCFMKIHCMPFISRT